MGGLGKLDSRFGFDDKFFIDDHINSLNGNDMAFVRHVNADFPRDSMTASDELAFQRHHVDMLVKAEPECVIDFEERSDHRASEPSLDQTGHTL